MRTKRNTPKRKPRYAFIVEGECEFWYIQMLKRNERSLRVDLKPEIPQKKKLKDQYKKVIDSTKEYDKVFWIIDFDVLIKESRENKLPRCKHTRYLVEESFFFENLRFSNIPLHTKQASGNYTLRD